ncbi:MAG: DegT/DnrJ/EryC1/StrS family aminotransferase [Actinomycetota bacterium]
MCLEGLSEGFHVGVNRPEEAGVVMSAPDISDLERVAVREVLESSALSMGGRIAAFEDAFAEYIGARAAVAVSSGTAGLHLAVILAGVREGDLVVTTPFSFIASANVVLYERATPIFIDVEPGTRNMDMGILDALVADFESGGSAITRWLPPSFRAAGDQVFQNEKLRAAIPVHVFGQPADMTSLEAVRRRHQFFVIEDACEAIGAEHRGDKTGIFGDVGVFGFYPNKQLTTGEGGMVVTDREAIADMLRSLRNQGRDATDPWLHHRRLGYNYRLDEMSCALGLAQLRRIDELLRRRERVASWYMERLEHVPELSVPDVSPDTSRMSWFVYVVRVGEGIDRNAVITELAEVGIPSRAYFTPIHLQPFYVERFGYRRGDFPVAEALGATCLALPFSGVMSEEQVDHVCRELARALQRSGSSDVP